MRKEYNFSDSIPNPYGSYLKQSKMEIKNFLELAKKLLQLF